MDALFLISNALVVQAVIEKERRGDFLGKTVQVCRFINCSSTSFVFFRR